MPSARCGQIEACESSQTPAAIHVTTTPAIPSSRREPRTATASSDARATHAVRVAVRGGSLVRLLITDPG